MSKKIVNPPRLQGLSRLRVRPKREKNTIPCGQEMAALLGCWQNHGGQTDTAQCANLVAALENCMKTTVCNGYKYLYTFY